jgi:hypothetical protein
MHWAVKSSKNAFNDTMVFTSWNENSLIVINTLTPTKRKGNNTRINRLYKTYSAKSVNCCIISSKILCSSYFKYSETLF